MSVFESIERHPVTYSPTGDRALLIAWAVAVVPYGDGVAEPIAILCLEDGRAVRASISEFTFDYRYDVAGDRWWDVSKTLSMGEDLDGDSDQETGDDGRSAVSGLVPGAD